MQSIKSLLEAKCQNVDVTTSSVILSEGPKRETDGRIIGRTVILERDDGRRLDERPQEPEPHKKIFCVGRPTCEQTRLEILPLACGTLQEFQ